ncbi:MAG: TetR/AcrR family transcriptional regulator [Phycisphaerae bacterium]|nr:TetR/AcrR family transcriptional regulator [Phycisphaerae bacterium]
MSRMNADDRRRQLLEAAVHCFAVHGYRGTTTAQLAREAGVSEPVLYRHFPSKQALFLALLEQAGRQTLSEWRKSIAPLASPMDQLRVLMRLNPATHPRLGLYYRIIFHAQTEMNDPLILQALRNHYQRYAQFLTRLIHAAQRNGEVRKDVLAGGLAWQLIQSAIGFAFLKPLEIPGHATPATVEQAIGLLVEQLSGQFPPTPRNATQPPPPRAPGSSLNRRRR